eukprot:COSAG06_NODE_181_length_20926_cov_7.590051_3_plen_89_part_00
MSVCSEASVNIFLSEEGDGRAYLSHTHARYPSVDHYYINSLAIAPPASGKADRIDFAVDFRCDFPMYCSRHSEIVIHSEIGKLRLMIL